MTKYKSLTGLSGLAVILSVGIGQTGFFVLPAVAQVPPVGTTIETCGGRPCKSRPPSGGDDRDRIQTPSVPSPSPEELAEKQRLAAFNAAMNRVRQHSDNGNWDGVIQALQEAAQYASNPADLHNQIQSAKGAQMHAEGLQHVNNGDFRKALAAFNRALELVPGDATIHRNRQAALTRIADADWKSEQEKIAGENAVQERAASQIHEGLKRAAEGFAARQAVAAEEQSREAASAVDSATAKEKAAFDLPAVLGRGLQVSPSSPAPSAAAVKPSRKAASPEAAALQGQIRELEQRSEILGQRISRERDPIKRAALINEKSGVESTKRVKEITLVDVLVRPPKPEVPSHAK